MTARALIDATAARRWLIERGAAFTYDRDGRPRDVVVRDRAAFHDPRTLATAAAAGFRAIAITTRELGWTERQRAGMED